MRSSSGGAGPSKLPELGKVLGQTVKSFQGAAKVCPTPVTSLADVSNQSTSQSHSSNTELKLLGSCYSSAANTAPAHIFCW